MRNSTSDRSCRSIGTLLRSKFGDFESVLEKLTETEENQTKTLNIDE